MKLKTHQSRNHKGKISIYWNSYNLKIFNINTIKKIERQLIYWGKYINKKDFHASRKAGKGHE